MNVVRVGLDDVLIPARCVGRGEGTGPGTRRRGPLRVGGLDMMYPALRMDGVGSRGPRGGRPFHRGPLLLAGGSDTHGSGEPGASAEAAVSAPDHRNAPELALRGARYVIDVKRARLEGASRGLDGSVSAERVARSVKPRSPPAPGVGCATIRPGAVAAGLGRFAVVVINRSDPQARAAYAAAERQARSVRHSERFSSEAARPATGQ
jgi:hypothetical protein